MERFNICAFFFRFTVNERTIRHLPMSTKPAKSPEKKSSAKRAKTVASPYEFKNPAQMVGAASAPEKFTFGFGTEAPIRTISVISTNGYIYGQ